MLLERLDVETAPRVLKAICESMGTLNFASAVPKLIEALSNDSDEVQVAAYQALVKITRQEGLGRDPVRWRLWYEERR